MNFFSILLSPFSWVYGTIIKVRNKRYDLGREKIHVFPIPVISIGNISAGGTGKTPFSMEMLEWLLESGMSPTWLARGYGRKSKGFHWVNESGSSEEFGDEAIMVKNRFAELPVAVCESRAEGIRRILDETKSNVVILDDAFQHRSVRRDLDIVVIDANKVPWKDALLPAGRLREPVASLKRADFLLFQKVPENFDIKEALNHCFGKPVALATIQPIALQPLTEAAKVIASEKPMTQFPIQQNIIAVSGLGNNQNFIHTQEKITKGSVIPVSFPDHHLFSPRDLTRILNIFAASKNEHGVQPIIVLSEKDYFRIQSHPIMQMWGEAPVFYMKVAMKWLGGRDELKQVLLKKIKAND